MAIHIQTGKHNIQQEVVQSKIQSLPFKIHADCDANIKKYFESYVKEGEDKILRASFRGYPLIGKKIDIPSGYAGVLLHESIKPSTDKEERKFYIVNNFNSVTFWNWGKIPSRNDPFIKALEWIDIAEALHSPVTEE